ncbi:MAG: hypothetical protein ACKO16_00180 [Gemmataceae bacterium]|jgi:hypothetical protein
MTEVEIPKIKIQPESSLLAKLFARIGEPVDPLKISAVNVYTNKWRINVWKSSNNPFLPNAGFIESSYFVEVGPDDEIKSIR